MRLQRAALVAIVDAKFRGEVAARAREAGMAVVEAGSADEALAGWRDEVGIVFLDASLAEGAGPVLERAREAGVPVQIGGNASQGEEILGLLKAGARGYLPFPRSAELVADKLCRMLAREEQRPLENTPIGQAKRELQAAFDTFPSALVVVGPDLCIRRANAAAVALSGSGSFDETYGQPVLGMLGLTDREEGRVIAEAVRGSREAEVEFELAWPDASGEPSGPGGGETASHRILHCRVFGGGARTAQTGPAETGGMLARDGPPAEVGPLEGALILIDDVTHRRREESARAHEQQLEAVTLLAASLSHEINQPLNTILGRAQLVQMTLDRDGFDKRHLRRDMEEIVGCVHRVSEILSKLRRVTEIVTKPYLDESRILDIERSAGGPGRKGWPVSR